MNRDSAKIFGASGDGGSGYRRRIARFGVFEFDLINLKLLRNGRDIGLQQQPAMLLAHLVNRAGSVVTRDELREALWPSGTYVEFDFGLNTTVNRLRRALRDSASEPSYIETAPKLGYRFIAPVELVMPPPEPGPEMVEVPSDLEQKQEFEPAASEAPRQAGPHRHWTGPAVAVAVGIAACLAAVFFVLHSQQPRTEKRAAVVRSYLSLPAGQIPEVLVISPTGEQIVYQATSGGVRQLYRRSLDEEESRLIAGSEDATQPFFSPDGSEIGFYTPTSIRILGPRGVRDLVAVPPEFDLRRAIWGEDQFIYYTTPVEGIWRVPADGGKPQPVVKPTAKDRAVPFYFPQQILIGSPPVLLFSTNNGPKHRWLASVAVSGNSAPEVLLERGMGGHVLSAGYLVYYWQGKLLAAPWDAAASSLLGSPMEVVSNVAVNGWRGPDASISGNGTLVYLEREEPRRKLTWVDRRGRETPLPVPVAAYEQAEVSPDGRKISVARRDAPGLWTLWMYDLRSGAWTRLLEQDVPYPRSVWSPDSKAVMVAAAFGDTQFVNLYRLSAAGSTAPERLTEQADYGQFPGSWSAAANAVLFTEGVHAGTQSDIFALPLNGLQRPRSLVATNGVDRDPAFSPDGRWFAYASDTKTESEVFVQRFDQSSPAHRISTAGGTDPAWAADGSRLFFLDKSHALMEVACERGSCTGTPHRLFPPGFAKPLDWWTRAYSTAPDGRFLVIREVDSESRLAPRIRVIVNWTEELRRLVPVPAPIE